jgi:lysophospholipase L1-like esterase
MGATRFLAFGDSITAGVFSSPDGGTLFDGSVRSYSERLLLGLRTFHQQQAGSFVVTNVGEPGELAINGARRLPGLLANQRPEGLLLLEGINDLNNGQSIPAVGGALESMLESARLNNVTVLIATMYQTRPVGDRTNSYTQITALNERIRQIAFGRPNVFLVDLYGSFGSNPIYVGGDGLHPTDAGHERIASEFLSAVEAAFPVRATFQ